MSRAMLRGESSGERGSERNADSYHPSPRLLPLTYILSNKHSRLPPSLFPFVPSSLAPSPVVIIKTRHWANYEDKV